MANQPSDLGSWMIFLFSILLYSGLSSTEELRFTVEPKNVIVVKDRPFIWDCQAEGEAPINITWKKNGQIIENNERHNVLRNGSLFFVRIERKKTKITDEGQYECVARNGDGAITAIADLQVATLSKFQSHLQNPKPVTASLGGVARFECHVDSLPPAVISWEKDKDPIPSNNRFVVLPSGVLQIHNIQESDAANYRCIAVNIANKRRSAEAPLTVQSTMPPTNEPDPDRKPIIVQGPKPETKEEGDTIVLECLVVRYSPDDPEPEVTWNRLGGSAINSDLGVPYGKNNLLISNLGMTSTGVYKCTATNPATGGAVSKTARITVLVPPRLLDVPESQAKLVGVTARFPCVAEGVPPPSITWYHNAQPVVMNGRFQNPSNNDDLVITNIWKNPHESDEGIYQCVAENVRGRVQASAQLTIIKVESTPSQPRNLQAFAYSSTEITVTWDHPEELSSIMAYNVLYRLTAGGSDKEVAVEGSKSICVLEILQPYTNYTVHIIPYVTSGAGDPSNYITVQTLEDIPDKAPEFTLSSNTPSSIIITWGPLEKEHAKGNIISYRIYYRYADHLDEPVLQVDVGGHIREYVLENLEPSTTYEVKMSASTSVGEGVMSQSWNSRTTPEFLDYNIPQAPLLYLWKVNSSAVQVQWSMHSVNVPTPVLGFKLYYALASNINDLAGPVMLPSNVTSYTLSGLLPSTSYFVLLLAYNDYGDGHDASRYIETLVPTPSINIPVNPAPPYPNEIDAIVETPSTILVKWSKPQTSLEIIYYTVRFHPAAITNASLVKKEESNTEQIMLMDLIPFTEYVIAVKAHARSSESRFSNDITANTPEDRPSSPTNFVVNVFDYQSVRLEWTPPEHPNGIITTYIILYNYDISAPEEAWNKDEKEGTVMYSVVQNLMPSVQCYFMMRASTGVGEGPPTDPVAVVLPAPSMTAPINTTRTTTVTAEPTGYGVIDEYGRDGELSLIVGITLAALCILVILVIIIYRTRTGWYSLCKKPYTLQIAIPMGNGHVPNCNGNGQARNYGRRLSDVELESFAPMLTKLPEQVNIDTKGGNGVVMNGYSPVGLHSNGVPPNMRLLSNSNTPVTVSTPISASSSSSGCHGDPTGDEDTTHHEENETLQTTLQSSIPSCHSDEDEDGGSPIDAMATDSVCNAASHDTDCSQKLPHKTAENCPVSLSNQDKNTGVLTELGDAETCATEEAEVLQNSSTQDYHGNSDNEVCQKSSDSVTIPLLSTAGNGPPFSGNSKINTQDDPVWKRRTPSSCELSNKSHLQNHQNTRDSQDIYRNSQIREGKDDKRDNDEIKHDTSPHFIELALNM